MKRYLQLLKKRPQLRRLWTANMVSLLGDWLSYVAISLLALHQGGGIVAVALVLVAYTLPQVLMSPLAGRVADRFDRRTIMLVTNGVRTVLTVAMALAALAGSIIAVEILLVVRVAVSAFFFPARSAALPQLVEREELEDANTIMTVSWSVIFTAGVALGGVLAAAVGPTTAIFVDAGTFVLATAILWGLPRIKPPRDLARRGGSLAAALRYAMGNPRLLRIVLGKAPIAVAGGAGWVYLNLAAEELAVGAALGLGLLHASRALGTGIGPTLLAATSRRAPWLRRLWVLNLVGIGGIVAFGLSGSLPLALAALAVWGMGSGALWVVTTTDLQRHAEGATLGRLTSFDVVLGSGGMAAGALAAAFAADAAGPLAAIVVAVLGGGAVWLLSAVLPTVLESLRASPLSAELKPAVR
jgi:MFS family permease